MLLLGLPDHFIDHGDSVRMLARLGLDAMGIEQSIRERFSALLQPRRVRSAANAES